MHAYPHCCTGQFTLLYRPIHAAVQANSLCCTGHFTLLYRPISHCCTGQFTLLYRPIHAAVQANARCCTGQFHTAVHANSHCCTDQFTLLYRPIHTAVQANSLCCTGQFACAVQANLHGVLPVKRGTFMSLQRNALHWTNRLKQGFAVCHSLNMVTKTVVAGLDVERALFKAVEARFLVHGHRAHALHCCMCHCGTLGCSLSKMLTNLVLWHTTFTCASKPGCLMSHIWHHTPDCKA